MQASGISAQHPSQARAFKQRCVPKRLGCRREGAGRVEGCLKRRRSSNSSDRRDPLYRAMRWPCSLVAHHIRLRQAQQCFARVRVNTQPHHRHGRQNERSK